MRANCLGLFLAACTVSSPISYNGWTRDEQFVLALAKTTWEEAGAVFPPFVAVEEDLDPRAQEFNTYLLCGLTDTDRKTVRIDRNCAEFYPFGESNARGSLGLEGLYRVALHEYGHVLGVKHNERKGDIMNRSVEDLMAGPGVLSTEDVQEMKNEIRKSYNR